jgi:protein-disulfide isomerase
MAKARYLVRELPFHDINAAHCQAHYLSWPKHLHQDVKSWNILLKLSDRRGTSTLTIGSRAQAVSQIVRFSVV